MKGPAVHVENLSLSLGNSQILSNMNFHIPSGSIHCFIGPNGGGKTSAIRCLLGQMPHKGTIQIDWDEDRTIGYVPQLLEMERTLPLTIDNFFAIIAQNKPAFTGLRKNLKPRIDELLEKVGLIEKRKFMIGSLSGGERQRLLFAQALMPSPALLILDEPMTSMDEAGVSIFENLITQMSQSGVTILWVNHDLVQVQRMSQSITVVDRGALITGPTESILTGEMLKGNFKIQERTKERKMVASMEKNA